MKQQMRTVDPLLRQLEKELGITPHTEIRCLGHTAPQIGRCYDCTNDERNKQCESYKAHRVFTYEVKK